MKFSARFLALDRIPRVFPDISLVDSVEKQEELLSETLLSPLAATHPLPPHHVQSFLKSLIRTCDDNQLEISERVYDLLSRKSSQNESYFGMFLLPNFKSVLFKVHGDIHAFVQNGSTGFVTWESGKCLSWHMATRSKDMQEPETILEIGCGTGVTGISIMKTCHNVKEYVFSDYHESTLEQAKENCSINSVENASFRQIDMMNDHEILSVDTIIGADILYDESLCIGLVKFLSNPQCQFKEAFIMSCIRNVDTYEVFQKALLSDENLTFSVVRRVKMSEWIELGGQEWRDFLDSSTLLFDIDTELVRITKKL